MNQQLPEDLSFGQWLRQRRRALDLTQQELADQVGCARITLRRIESDALKPSRELALILLEKLGIPEGERSKWVFFARGNWQTSPSTQEREAASLDSHIHQPSDFRLLNTLGPTYQNLPLQLTSFIGRQNEQAEVKNLIATNRLVTLTGAGGIGKTRLAIQVALALLNHFPSGTWLVELAPLSDPGQITQVVLTTLGLTEQTGRSPLRVLIDFLRRKQALLILDNCEHLIAACVQLSHDLLTHCPRLQIVATSREPLKLTGEAGWQVPPLSTPRGEMPSEAKPPLSFESVRLFVERSKTIQSDFESFESIRLFVERAKTIRPDFELNDQNATSLAQICQHLDGIPLAIELAAARIRIMTPEEIASHLDNRFDLLKQGQRTAMPHHQTLHATIDWSYSLLTEEERVLFCRLSVFAGGWTLKAVETICSNKSLELVDIFAILSHLVDKSLVSVETRNEMSRFQMLETIREYAREKLFESREREVIHRSHLDFFTHWMQQIEPKFYGPEQIFWMDQVETEHNNLRVALQWAAKNDVEKGLQLAGSLGWFWYTRGYLSEGIGWLTKLVVHDIPQSEEQFIALGYKGMLSLLTGDIGTVIKIFTVGLQHLNVASPRTMAWALRGNAIFRAASGGDLQSALAWAERAINLSQSVGDDWQYGMSLYALGDVYLYAVKDYAMAEPAYENSLKVFRRIGDKFGIAHVLMSFGLNHLRQRNYVRAGELELEALSLLRELRDKAGVGWTLTNLYHLARFQRDYEGAQLLAGERLIFWRDLGFDLQIAWATYDLGRIDVVQNNLDMAASHFAESITFFQQKGSLKDKILCLLGPVHLLLAQGKLENATQLFAAFNTLSKENHIELEIGDQEELDTILGKLRAQLEENQFARAWSKGEKMPLDEAVVYALQNN